MYLKLRLLALPAPLFTVMVTASISLPPRLGTVAVKVVLLLITIPVPAMPLKLTAVPLIKYVPVRVTLWPAEAEEGDMPVKLGGCAEPM